VNYIIQVYKASCLLFCKLFTGLVGGVYDFETTSACLGFQFYEYRPISIMYSFVSAL